MVCNTTQHKGLPVANALIECLSLVSIGSTLFFAIFSEGSLSQLFLQNSRHAISSSYTILWDAGASTSPLPAPPKNRDALSLRDFRWNIWSLQKCSYLPHISKSPAFFSRLRRVLFCWCWQRSSDQWLIRLPSSTWCCERTENFRANTAIFGFQIDGIFKSAWPTIAAILASSRKARCNWLPEAAPTEEKIWQCSMFIRLCRCICYLYLYGTSVSFLASLPEAQSEPPTSCVNIIWRSCWFINSSRLVPVHSGNFSFSITHDRLGAVFDSRKCLVFLVVLSAFPIYTGLISHGVSKIEFADFVALSIQSQPLFSRSFLLYFRHFSFAAP